MALKFKEDPDFAAHNSRANDTAARELKSMLEQIEAAIALKKDASKDESDIYVVAKSKGYNVRALKKLVQERRRDMAELEEERDALDLYKQLVGMI
jgi:uncharacterized protein (UPF0335 family)